MKSGPLGLFLLGAVSAHAELTTCDDDHSSLLQAQISQGRVGAAEQPKEQQVEDGLLQSMTSVAKSLSQSSSNVMTPEAVEAAVQAATAALQTIRPNLDTQHDSAQSEVNRQFAEIQACERHTAHGLDATNQHSRSRSNLEAAMNQCNSELADAQTTQTRACEAWTSHANTLSSSEPSCGHTSTPEQFFEHFETWHTWVNDFWDETRNKRADCISSTTAVSTKQEECSTATTDYETAYCAHRMSCALFSACQSHEIQVYEAQIVDERARMNIRLEQYRVVQHVECLLRLITTAVQSGGAIEEEELNQCSESVDVGDLTIDFPSAHQQEGLCPAEDDTACPELAEVESVTDWSRGQALRHQVAVTVGGAYDSILTDLLPCDGTQLIGSESVSHPTNGNCEARDQCVLEVREDCFARVWLRDRCLSQRGSSGRTNDVWTDYTAPGETAEVSTGHCSITVGEMTPLLAVRRTYTGRITHSSGYVRDKPLTINVDGNSAEVSWVWDYVASGERDVLNTAQYHVTLTDDGVELNNEAYYNRFSGTTSEDGSLTGGWYNRHGNRVGTFNLDGWGATQ